MPLIWNSANVSPIFKKGEKSAAADYRPISLTCNLCKVMEHIIASNVAKHLDSNGLMYDLQHGFRERRSCETQLISLVEDLARKTSQKKKNRQVLYCWFSPRLSTKSIVVLVFFPPLGLWSWNFFLIEPFPDHCLLVPSFH